MLFSAFEKHQYYNIKDLVDITKQPVVSIQDSDFGDNCKEEGHNGSNHSE